MKEVSDKSVTDSRIFTSRLPVRGGSGLMITPLLDMLFLLFAFVAVGSTLAKYPGIKIDTPQTTLTEVPTWNVSLVITITAKKQFYLNNINSQSLDGLEQELSKYKPSQKDLDSKKRNAVILRADKKVSYETINSVVDICQKNGLVVIFHKETKNE